MSPRSAFRLAPARFPAAGSGAGCGRARPVPAPRRRRLRALPPGCARRGRAGRARCRRAQRRFRRRRIRCRGLSPARFYRLGRRTAVQNRRSCGTEGAGGAAAERRDRFSGSEGASRPEAARRGAKALGDDRPPAGRCRAGGCRKHCRIRDRRAVGASGYTHAPSAAGSALAARRGTVASPHAAGAAGCSRPRPHPPRARRRGWTSISWSVSAGISGATITAVGMPAAASSRITESRRWGDGARGSMRRARSASSVVIDTATWARPSRAIGEQVEVAQDQRRLGDDGHRMARFGQHFEDAARDAQPAFHRLPGVGVDAQRHRPADVAGLGQFGAQAVAAASAL
jgi:hypothetical protein